MDWGLGIGDWGLGIARILLQLEFSNLAIILVYYIGITIPYSLIYC